MVLARKGNQVKLVRYGLRGMEDYTHHRDLKRRASYLARSAGIRDKRGKLTKDDVFSANYWARKDLWAANPIERNVIGNRIMAKKNPRGFGKFDTHLAEYAYQNPDEQLGSVDELGWYGMLYGKVKGRGPFYVIVKEDSQGFVTAETYETEKEMRRVWGLIERDYEEYYEENQE
jgi:hypothetical protein